MGTDFLSGSGLQSGFVLAVIIAAVLLANNLGGGAGLARKAAQVALGLALMMLVFSATTAFHGAPDVPIDQMESIFESDGPEEFLEASRDSAARSSQVGTIHIGLGIIFVALGVVVFTKLGGLTPGLLLGGVLLILLGAPEGGGGPGQPSERADRITGRGIAGELQRRWNCARDRPIRCAGSGDPAAGGPALLLGPQGWGGGLLRGSRGV